MKEVPVLYKRKEECCGCTACYAICPKEAISMVEDEEGFEYPKIDENKCSLLSVYQGMSNQSGKSTVRRNHENNITYHGSRNRQSLRNGY